MCKVLGVSPSGYYRWVRSPVSKKEYDDIALLELIKEHYHNSRSTYGVRRICASLRQTQGLRCNKKRIARLMKNNNIRAKTKRRFKLTTNSKGGGSSSPNLLKQDSGESRVWTSDITYLWTREGWLYLAVIIDVLTRRIIGWTADKYLRAELVGSAFIKALGKCQTIEGVIFHSDRGSQYRSQQLRQLLKTSGLKQSMGSSCYDNAIAESFFHTLKTELVYWERYETRQEAQMSLFEYIEVFYNRQRLHSSLGYLSPVEFEMKNSNLINQTVA